MSYARRDGKITPAGPAGSIGEPQRATTAHYDTGLNATWSRFEEITDNAEPSGKAMRRTVYLTSLGPAWTYEGDKTCDPRITDDAHISMHQAGGVSVRLLIYRDDKLYGSLSAEDFVTIIKRQLREATADLLTETDE